jgi:hypothetical protein
MLELITGALIMLIGVVAGAAINETSKKKEEKE